MNTKFTNKEIRSMLFDPEFFDKILAIAVVISLIFIYLTIQGVL